MSHLLSRRDFSLRLAAALPGLGVVGTASSPHPGAMRTGWQQGDGISHNNDAIHQEVTFKATRARVYAALTRTAEFDKVVRLSAAMKGGIPADAPPTAISGVAGGTFTLFGGYVTGRQIELVPDQRIVQAWRAGSWKAGAYSIARFELADEGMGCRLEFDHTGFPAGEAGHLATGWHVNYWTPLANSLA